MENVYQGQYQINGSKYWLTSMSRFDSIEDAKLYLQHIGKLRKIDQSRVVLTTFTPIDDEENND